MVSRYSIIQYVPNPIADERMNIGVLAFDNENVRVQFLRNWSRVHDFGGENIRFLRDFAKKCDLSVSWINQVETGVISDPSYLKIKKNI